MTAKAALNKALLLGRTVNVKTGFKDFGLTNIPREVGRSVERSFGVNCERTLMFGESRYKQATEWVDYRLPVTTDNIPGIKKMVDYVLKIEGEPKTQDQAREQERIKKLLLL